MTDVTEKFIQLTKGPDFKTMKSILYFLQKYRIDVNVNQIPNLWEINYLEKDAYRQ